MFRSSTNKLAYLSKYFKTLTPELYQASNAQGSVIAASNTIIPFIIPKNESINFSMNNSRGFAAVPQTESSFCVQRDSMGHITPHGGNLTTAMVKEKEIQSKLISECQGRVIHCSDRNACDIECLAVGAFSPISGPMSEEDYNYCVENMRLKGSDLLFGLPVVLDTDDKNIKEGHKVALMYNGVQLGVLEVHSKFFPNKPKEAKLCYGTSSLEHPGVQMISMERGKYYLGGKLSVFELPKRVFPCATPKEVREMLPTNIDVVAFQCRNPVHRAHYELFTRALDAPNVGKDGVCLVHPTCGPTQDDDIPGIVRYHTYEVLKEEVKNPRIKWAYLPYSMHMAGPREAIQHMMIRKNYGCTHFIIGRDMAGSKSSLSGDDFYGAYDAQDMANKYSSELGVQTVPSLNVVYTEEEGYVTADVAEKKGLHVKKLSGTKFRKMLRAGEEIPEWFAFKSVVKVLREHTSKSE